MGTDVETSDERTMWRALDLAARGRGGTSPNPMVGAVIVRGDGDGTILGEGWHHRAGGPHAEIEALAAARAVGHDVRGATMFVTLEPCCHVGRTGPCTKAIIAAGIARVVVGAGDPNPLVAGNGIAELVAAGIDVRAGVLADAAEALNVIFAKWITTRRPWVRLKLALSLDGAIAARAGVQTALTGASAARRVHALRAEVDAVMVGSRTAVVDQPRLDVRERDAVDNAEFLEPAALVVDSYLRTPADAPLFARAERLRIAATALPQDHERAVALAARGVTVVSLPGRDGRVDLAGLMPWLGALAPRPVTSLQCEGGGVLARSLLDAGLVDELVTFYAPTLLGERGVPGFGDLESEGSRGFGAFRLHALEKAGRAAMLTWRRR